ncbi:MAG: 2-oxoglutarate dehydrogenase complex dihydrolipoyllysine-residue succinyltransferase [Armatimonadota bacterium]
MPIKLIVPSVGESITEVQIGVWMKNAGDQVEADQPIVEIESDKATLELPAPTAGTITEVLKKQGEKANVGDIIGYMEESLAPTLTKGASNVVAAVKDTIPAPSKEQPRVMPAAARVMAENQISAAQVTGTGPGGRVLKEDAERSLEVPLIQTSPAVSLSTSAPDGREIEIVPMSPMRQRIAQRLVEAQQTAALLTTFNEVDMSSVMTLRKEHQDSFLKQYNIKLGFMSFFVKACIDALKQHPSVNAEVQGENIVYRNFFDIGIAVGGGKGLVVPVIRNAERMSFAEIEMAISDFGVRAKANKIALEELKGGTFTISNGGIYGSLLSTPIVNPPQSGILGLHAIQDRPVAVDGQVVIRPMMYIALTYDHRVVDGREAVTFLNRVKDCIENPARMLLEI